MAGTSGYSFNANILAQVASRGNPQKQNMAILEFQADNLVPGLKETLALTITSFEMPNRVMGRGEIHYFNGVVFYPTKPDPLGELTVTFRDYTDISSRAILENWFNIVYNENTGIMTSTSDMKTDANMVLFNPDVAGTRSYLLQGIFPLSRPAMSADHSNGEQYLMEITFSVDFIKPQFDVGNVTVGG